MAVNAIGRTWKVSGNEYGIAGDRRRGKAYEYDCPQGIEAEQGQGREQDETSYGSIWCGLSNTSG